jgi:hypothetical protein
VTQPNVRDHRWVAVARPMAGSDSDPASGVTRVAIRWIALFKGVQSEGSFLASATPFNVRLFDFDSLAERARKPKA